MSTSPPSPLVGVSACRSTDGNHPSHRCSEKYLQAVIDPTSCIPMILPVLADPAIAEIHAEQIDGLLLTGGAANVEPRHYGGPASVEGRQHDPHRDQSMLPLIRHCLTRGVPVLGLCLGIQEINVALGGSLHQQIVAMTDRFDHRMRRDVDDHEQRYRPAHSVHLTPGGQLHQLLDETEILVNSLHSQGLDRLGEGIQIEAVAPDGIIEAISVEAAPGFAVGVQWHPEWPRPITGYNRKIFEAFGDACRAYARRRYSAGSAIM